MRVLRYPTCLPILMLLLLGLATSCVRLEHHVEPLEVKPITMNVNVNVKVDRELDEFFAFEESYRATPPASTQPATTATTATDALPAATGSHGEAQ